MNTWHCTTCDKTLQKSSKYKHLKSKSHSMALQVECDLCLNESRKFKNCLQCVHSWCSDCHTKMDKCPFCRKPFHMNRMNRIGIHNFYVVHFDEHFYEMMSEEWEPTVDLVEPSEALNS
jgi:hypothetical protein